MGLCLGIELPEDREARIRSAGIDRELLERAKRDMKEVRVLLLGESRLRFDSDPHSDPSINRLVSTRRSGGEREEHFSQTDEDHPQRRIQRARAPQLQGEKRGRARACIFKRWISAEDLG